MRNIFLSFALLFSLGISAQTVILNGSSNNQQISYNPTSKLVSITGGGSIDLTDLVGGSTVSDLSLSGNILSVTLDDGTPVTLDLSTIKANIALLTLDSLNLYTPEQRIAKGWVGRAILDPLGVPTEISFVVGDGTISTAKIADGGVTTSKIADGTILETDLATAVQTKLNSVGSTTLNNTTISTATDEAATANVAKTLNDKIDLINFENLYFTKEGKKVLKQRFDDEYVTGTGFTNDFTRALAGVATFMADPTDNRPVLGSPFSLTDARQVMYYTALYAYAYDSIAIANVVATELLATANSNDMDAAYWATNPNFGADSDLWLQTAEVKKMKDAWHLIQSIQNTLSIAEKDTLDQWFADYASHVLTWVNSFFTSYWGASWWVNGVSTFLPETLLGEISYWTPYPVHDAADDPITAYGMTGAQNQFNNRIAEQISFLHSWAVENGDILTEIKCREYFKNLLKYGLFSDGTFWETARNKNTLGINALGVLYSFSTLSAMVHIAHVDALANHFPNDRLYDYETTEGVINGSTALSASPYAGGSTTDGVTKKSLKTFIIGQSKYYRTTANGGWNDVRFFAGSPLNMTGTSERDYSTPQAIANLYYKDDDIKDFYLYNTSVGYPSKDSYMDGNYFGSDGNIGTSLLGGAWFEQENNFFQYRTYANGLASASGGGITDLSTFTSDNLLQGATNLYSQFIPTTPGDNTTIRKNGASGSYFELRNSSTSPSLTLYGGTAGNFAGISLVSPTGNWKAAISTTQYVITDVINSVNVVTIEQGATLNSLRIRNNGNVGIGVAAPSYKLDVGGTAQATQFKLSALNTAPVSATSTGVLGEIRIVADYIYICTATNTWVRTALATW